MQAYGPQKVRGHAWCQVNLQEYPRTLDDIACTGTTCCLRCGRSDHELIYCDATKTYDGLDIIDVLTGLNQDIKTDRNNNNNNNKCPNTKNLRRFNGGYKTYSPLQNRARTNYSSVLINCNLGGIRLEFRF